MQIMWSPLIGIPWLVFVIYWIISAFKTRKTQKKEPFAWRYGVMLVEALGFTLLSSERTELGFLGHRLLPRSDALSIVSIVLVWIGIALALWARWHLGEYWSGRITLKEGHKLIRTGPYARLRHPIYSGLDLAAIGTALAIDRWRCIAGVGVIILGFWIKAKREEGLLAGQFGEEFQEHLRQTGFLLPHF
jgi:protein-S-isoprenylcysteine O-methyltransferase Ste14